MLVALVSLLIGRRPRADTSALGEVTAHGLLMAQLEPFTSKDVTLCSEKGLRRLVVAEAFSVESEGVERQAGKPHPRDGRPTLELIRTSNFLEALYLFFEGLG